MLDSGEGVVFLRRNRKKRMYILFNMNVMRFGIKYVL